MRGGNDKLCYVLIKTTLIWVFILKTVSLSIFSAFSEPALRAAEGFSAVCQKRGLRSYLKSVTLSEAKGLAYVKMRFFATRLCRNWDFASFAPDLEQKTKVIMPILVYFCYCDTASTLRMTFGVLR
jgi:hypothetical protein